MHSTVQATVTWSSLCAARNVDELSPRFCYRFAATMTTLQSSVCVWAYKRNDIHDKDANGMAGEARGLLLVEDQHRSGSTFGHGHVRTCFGTSRHVWIRMGGQPLIASSWLSKLISKSVILQMFTTISGYWLSFLWMHLYIHMCVYKNEWIENIQHVWTCLELIYSIIIWV